MAIIYEKKGPGIGGSELRKAAVLLLVCAAFAVGHDIPNDVTVQMFVRPVAGGGAGHGPALQVLVRVPMSAIRDIDFPQRSGYLDLERTAPMLPDMAQMWIGNFLELYEDDTRLPRPRVAAARIALDSDRAFASYATAAAAFTAPRLGNDVSVVWNQTMLDVWFEYPVASERSRFSVHPALARLGQRVIIVLRFLPPGGAVRAFEFLGDPGLVRLDPRWHQAALRFVRLGFNHILDGTDHLLFLLCLVIPFRRLRALVPVVTAFTAAHSITLIASAYNLAPDALWFPPLIETLIAASIVYMALENIVGNATVHRRWMIAFGFGLVHGFGFSFALRETLQFAGTHLLTSLLSFNIGVELGQLAVLAAMIPALELLFRRVVAERMGTIILSAIVAHTGWHWMTERWDRLTQYRFTWPEITLPMVAAGLRWAAALAAAAGLVWWLAGILRRRAEAPAARRASGAGD